MRWDALFADLEGEAEAEAAAERWSEVSDRTRTELGRLRLIDRLNPLLPPERGRLRVGLAGHDAVAGELEALGADWLLLTQPDAGGRELLIPLAAVQWLQGATRQSAEPDWEGRVGARLTVRMALRRIVRDRSAVSLGLTSGDAFTGRLGRVGADHCELALAGSLDGADTGRLTIPIGALAFVGRR